jgi:hypothetical protein
MDILAAFLAGRGIRIRPFFYGAIQMGCLHDAHILCMHSQEWETSKYSIDDIDEIEMMDEGH